MSNHRREDATTEHTPCTLLDTFIKLEYEYLTQSSSHSDDLRNKFIEFYLIIVSAAATAILGLLKLQAGDSGKTPIVVPVWMFSGVAFLIGFIGLIMLPIFVRLRRVVLECLQGTVLLKRYVTQSVTGIGRREFSDALLWDGHSLPQDERYHTASFLLVFLFVVLDSAMFGLAAFLFLSGWQHLCVASLWGLAVLTALVTLQVVFYRWRLWTEIRRARDHDQLDRKWRALNLGEQAELKEPALLRPVQSAVLIGGAITALLVCLALAATVVATLR